MILESTGVYGKLFVKTLSASTLELFELNPLIIQRLSSSMVQTKTDQADAVRLTALVLFLTLFLQLLLWTWRGFDWVRASACSSSAATASSIWCSPVPKAPASSNPASRPRPCRSPQR